MATFLCRLRGGRELDRGESRETRAETPAGCLSLLSLVRSHASAISRIYEGLGLSTDRRESRDNRACSRRGARDTRATIRYFFPPGSGSSFFGGFGTLCGRVLPSELPPKRNSSTTKGSSFSLQTQIIRRSRLNFTASSGLVRMFAFCPLVSCHVR